MPRQCLVLGIGLWLAAGVAARAQIGPAFLLDESVTLTADFHSVSTGRVEQLARDGTAAERASQSAIPYRARRDKVEVLEAYTLKPDGRRLTVGADAIQHEGMAAAAADVLTDQKRVVILFPDVQPGDRTVFSARITRSAPVFPGGYADEFTVPAAPGGAEARVAVTAPPGVTLAVAAQGFEESSETDSGTAPGTAPGTRVWHYASTRDHAPATLLLSSYPDYDALGHALAAGFLDAIAVTPPIQALADQVTAGSSDRREQAQRLYAWVSQNIRYVDIQIGDGGVVPHPADEVLRNRYGDCKDHSVLLAALLQAKGIAARVALINGEAGYELVQPPVLGSLDHAIVFVPELGLYADSTARVAPFGTLPFREYGKPTVMMLADGPVLARTPVLPPGVARWQVDGTATLDLSGAIAGSTRVHAEGPFATELRLLAEGYAAQGNKVAAGQQLRMLGEAGSGDFTIHDDAGLSPAYAIGGAFSLPPRPKLLEGASFRFPAGLQPPVRPGNFLQGSLPDAAPGQTAPVPCWSGEETETLALTLPVGRQPRALPPPVSIEGGAVGYARSWSVEGRTVTLHRSFTSRATDALCGGPARADTAAALAKIRADYRTDILALAPAAASAP